MGPRLLARVRTRSAQVDYRTANFETGQGNGTKSQNGRSLNRGRGAMQEAGDIRRLYKCGSVS